eukprot:CAMPEP_0204608938 /NCGR_PEP_ID=MMETSP0661-20131031/60622_1 /ASSEMBLY_ACC=CAM_ASM_000606 /TAXON_ID=109239 /ORGANISM="Alexandrium margalefi, Strain AMGDE01CS-322" /LENGTH=48 /DNA_ID= /DNA_START= /DNA_END= /DNA_ORIENTATION=
MRTGPVPGVRHLTSTTAPASSSCFFASSQMSFGLPSMMVPGLSTMPLA